MALILGLKNTTTQTVPINGLINLGTVYRKNCKRTKSGWKMMTSKLAQVKKYAFTCMTL